jgi:hypothetical protein
VRRRHQRRTPQSSTRLPRGKAACVAAFFGQTAMVLAVQHSFLASSRSALPAAGCYVVGQSLILGGTCSVVQSVHSFGNTGFVEFEGSCTGFTGRWVGRVVAVLFVRPCRACQHSRQQSAQHLSLGVAGGRVRSTLYLVLRVLGHAASSSM